MLIVLRMIDQIVVKVKDRLALVKIGNVSEEMIKIK